jgi:hypothetical protein
MECLGMLEFNKGTKDQVHWHNGVVPEIVGTAI